MAVGKRYWQNRQLGEYAPAWDPGGRHSPNSLFAAAMSQGGFSLQIPPASLYYELLPVSFVKVHGKRGVKIGGLWYDGGALDPYRGQPSARGGRHKGMWEVRRDKRDPRYVVFRDPDGGWHTLRWTGLPPDGEPPAFGDARREDLLRAARRAGLAPKSDAELLPVPLELAGAHVPVDQWPGQLTRQQRVQHARKSPRRQPQPPPALSRRGPRTRAGMTRRDRSGPPAPGRPLTRWTPSGAAAASGPWPGGSPSCRPRSATRPAGRACSARRTTPSGRSARTIPGTARDRPGRRAGRVHAARPAL